MKIAIVSKADRHGGGASSVAESQVRFLRERGIYAQHFVSWHGPENSERVLPLYGDRAKWVRKIQKKMDRVGLPDLLPYEYLLSGGLLREYDLVHFHDLSSAVSPYTLKWLSKHLPVVWTFHDCSPFTGGCLYPMECERYTLGCGDCPQIGQWPLGQNFDFTRKYVRIKKALFQLPGVHPVTPSQWMADMAMESGVLSKPPLVIPNYVDTDVFYPRNKEVAKKRYNLPTDRTIILLSAGNILDPRKGTLDAVSALKAVAPGRVHLLLVGNYSPEASDCLGALEHTFTGYIGDKEVLSIAYSAADIFLFPTKADNMPLVVLETMACGTPTISYSVGGLPEMIEDHISGRLVPEGNVGELSKALEATLTSRDYKKWSVASALRAKEFFSVNRFSEAHINLYQQLLK